MLKFKTKVGTYETNTNNSFTQVVNVNQPIDGTSIRQQANNMRVSSR